MSKQRRIKSNDTNRATFKRPHTMATLRDKSTKLTVARAPKYDKQTAKSPINRIHARRRVKRRRRQKPLDVEAQMSASRSMKTNEGRHIYRNKVATT
jgi:hypothetical protein